MPFTSQKQRGLFYAAKNDPEVRAKTGISQAVADKMTGEDQPGKLPRYAKGNPQHNPNAYGSGDKRMHGLLAPGAAGGKIKPAPNRMSTLPGGSTQSARPPGPRTAPAQGLATWGALRGMKRPAPRHVAPAGRVPGAMGAAANPVGAKAPPRANPVGMGSARPPFSPHAPRQIR
ncbi:MAG TPA: hypothetical protein VGG62_01155 [Terracidiphilus sp.]